MNQKEKNEKRFLNRIERNRIAPNKAKKAFVFDATKDRTAILSLAEHEKIEAQRVIDAQDRKARKLARLNKVVTA